MALQFDPGAYFAAYQMGEKNRQRPDLNELVSEPLQQTLQTLLQSQQQRKQQEMQQQAFGLQKQAADREQQTYEDDNTPLSQLLSSSQLSQPVSTMDDFKAPQDMNGFTPPSVSTGTLSLMGPSPMAPEVPQTPQGSMIEKFRSFRNGKRPMAQPMPQTPQAAPMGIDQLLSPENLSRLSLKQIERISNIKENLGKGRPELFSPDQLAATGLDQSTVDKLKVQYPNGIPKEVASMASTNLNRSAMMSNRTDNQAFQNENQLQTKFLSESKDFKDTATSYQRIIDSANNPSAAGDLALIFNYMKMLDPGSTVREGEFANAQNSGSVPERIQAQYNKIISGERLSQSMRNDFVGRSSDLYRGQEGRHKQREEEFKRVASGYGFNPDRVVINLRTKQGPQVGDAPGVAAQSKPKSVIQNGHTYTLNEGTGQYE